MRITVPTTLIASLWEALQKPPMGADPHKAERLFLPAVETGWIAHLELEALLLALEPRLHLIRPQHLLGAFGIQGQFVYRRPAGREASVAGIERVAIADVAHLLILMERLGFAIDPAPLCAALRPGIVKQHYLTRADLAVLWHAREQHRMEPLELAAEDRTWRLPDDPVLRLGTGYTVRLSASEAGSPVALWADPPKRLRAARRRAA